MHLCISNSHLRALLWLYYIIAFVASQQNTIWRKNKNCNALALFTNLLYGIIKIETNWPYGRLGLLSASKSDTVIPRGTRSICLKIANLEVYYYQV